MQKDPSFQQMVEQCIKDIFNFQGTVQASGEVNAQNIAANIMTTNGTPMVVSDDSTAVIVQKTRLKNTLQSTCALDFLKDKPVENVMVISSLLELDKSVEDMADFYNPEFVLELLGYETTSAQYDLENNRIVFTLGSELRSVNLDDVYKILSSNFVSTLNEKMENINEKTEKVISSINTRLQTISV
ncbi:MAG: hypothetical protein LBD75_00225, partial [Candidatus Peribacteria bacterium]|nr:hypothetical protein [Candidatus Peribacteria bacterium]